MSDLASLIILSVLWIISATIEGFIQGHYYDSVPIETKKHINMHPFFVAMRTILLGLIVYEFYIISDLISAFIFAVCQASIFSFFHNGTYYATRHWLNCANYKEGFWDSSETSKAVVEFGLSIRIFLLIFGLAGLYLLNLNF